MLNLFFSPLYVAIVSASTTTSGRSLHIFMNFELPDLPLSQPCFHHCNNIKVPCADPHFSSLTTAHPTDPFMLHFQYLPTTSTGLACFIFYLLHYHSSCHPLPERMLLVLQSMWNWSLCRSPLLQIPMIENLQSSLLALSSNILLLFSIQPHRSCISTSTQFPEFLLQSPFISH